MAEIRGTVKGYAPVFGEKPAALVLGTYPSPKSFEVGFYYGHKQNRFWPLMAALAGAPAIPQTITEKTALIQQSGLALWDVLERCTITGASDASIKDPVPNDVAGFIRRHGVQAVFCNGAASHRFYRRFSQPHTGIEAVQLPSTSPANAAFSFQRLLKAWQPLVQYITPLG
ncbi:MAG: DNA-deoxyinosine glycosylase [Ruminococcaceae bacterium]|nr:DNA-deoxyinosine glycosylase [Oscillospiraceae bacterium]